MNVGTLGPTDADAALRLSRQAGWGMCRADWERLLTADEVTAVGGRVDGALVATTTVADYGDVGWVGCVLVDEPYRRRGLGSDIFETACERADSPVLGLDANPTGQPIYERAGFRTVTTVAQYEGRPDATPAADVREAGPADYDTVAAFDQRRTGLDRGWLLRAFADDPETTLLVAESDGIDGYALLHPDTNGWNLGPVVADAPESAERLVRHAATVVADPLTVRVPDAPTASSVDWTELGFKRQRALARMIRPPRGPPLAGGAVRAILAYAFG